MVADFAHDTLVAVLSERPAEILALLALAGRSANEAGIWRVADSAIRWTDAAEVRPDLVFTAGEREWMLIEVQRAIDAEKARRWPLAMAAMLDRHGVMGELVVITSSPHVAAWARGVAHHASAHGTRWELSPIVLLLHGKVVDALLDPSRPELAFYAAWAMHERHGATARRVVARALALSETLPADLKHAQKRAILKSLSDAMLHWLKEASVDLSKVPESPALREWRLELEAVGEARGKAEALLTILSARGIEVREAQRATILGCADVVALERWLRASVSVDRADALWSADTTGSTDR